MANVSIGGLRYWGSVWGGPSNAAPLIVKREVASGYSTALFTGDPLIQVSDGTVAQAIGTEGSPSATTYGVAVGYSYVINGVRESRPTVPASTTFSPTAVGSVNATHAFVIPLAIGMIFEADADDGSTITTTAGGISLIGENVDLIVAAGDATTGVSGVLIDISTHNTTNTLNWRILNIVERADNDMTATRAKYLITPNICALSNILGV
jgi:hypothetical protein